MWCWLKESRDAQDGGRERSRQLAGDWPVSGPVGVMALIAVETAVGAYAITWLTGIWGHARRGFFLLIGITVSLLAWAGWAATRAGVAAGPADPGAVASLAPALLLAFAGLVTAWTAALAFRATGLARVLGLPVAVLGVAALGPLAMTRGDAGGLAVAEVALGAVFLGSALYGLVLGHWYLFERRLDKAHMVRGAQWYAAGCVAAAGSAALSATNPAPAPGGFSPFLAVPGFSLYLAVGLVAVCALIAGFTWKLATEGGRSIQAGTGLFYLAVIMAFSAEVSAKVRFFGVT